MGPGSTAASDRRIESTIARLQGIFTEHLDAVFNVAYRTVWNRADAEDVVQATFLKVATRLDQLDEVDRERPWLLQIAYREAIAVIRRRRDLPTPPDATPEVATPEGGPEELVVAIELARIITAALAALHPEQRAAVVLRDVEELPMRDVATVLDVGLSTAKMRVHRGRAALRTSLERELNDAV
jgi:RNA polymerase sigma-70 factor (ECF subfamily)